MILAALDVGPLAAWAVLLVLAAALLALTRRAGGRRWPRTAAGVAGLLAVAVALGPDVEARADELLSWHMVQHLLLQAVAAPLLVAAAPVSLLLGALPRPAGRRLARGLRHPVVRALGHPAAGVVAYALVLAVVHVPAVYDGALRHPLVHDGEHAALFWSAVWLWAPLLRSDPLPHAPGAVGRAAALLGAMAAMSVVGVVLATAADVAYPSYAAATGAARALHDQGVAGGIMWIGGMVVGLPLLLGLAWRALVEEERRATVRAARAGGGGPRA